MCPKTWPISSCVMGEGMGCHSLFVFLFFSHLHCIYLTNDLKQGQSGLSHKSPTLNERRIKNLFLSKNNLHLIGWLYMVWVSLNPNFRMVSGFSPKFTYYQISATDRINYYFTRLNPIIIASTGYVENMRRIKAFAFDVTCSHHTYTSTFAAMKFMYIF
jgi:hypothetical protein